MYNCNLQKICQIRASAMFVKNAQIWAEYFPIYGYSNKWLFYIGLRLCRFGYFLSWFNIGQGIRKNEREIVLDKYVLWRKVWCYFKKIKQEIRVSYQFLIKTVLSGNKIMQKPLLDFKVVIWEIISLDIWNINSSVYC